MLDSNGVSDFHSRRRQLSTPGDSIVYKAFDLLWFDGEDLRPLLAWSNRNECLAVLLESLPEAAATVISYVEPIYDEGF